MVIKKKSLFGHTINNLTEVCEQAGLPAFAPRQMADWLYRKHAQSIGQMSNLPKSAREGLDNMYTIGTCPPESVLVSSDGTKKYLYRINEDRYVESAYIPESNRGTLCVSTQIGCRRGCAFCMTGKQGFHGNLSAGQILNQYEALPERGNVTNIVYMGMGEPLDNIEAVVKSLEILTNDYGYAMSPRRITVSTVGIMPELRRLTESTDCNIAISLHSPFPAERRSIMPVEATHPIADSIAFLKSRPVRRIRRVSFEYILLDGINDSKRHAVELNKLLHGIRCRVNLIPYNRNAETQFAPSKYPGEFRDMLSQRGMIATIRSSRGQDISAACGLLSTTKLKE